jgi:hypothetical protein
MCGKDDDENGIDRGYHLRDAETASLTASPAQSRGGSNCGADAGKSRRSASNSLGRAFQSDKTCSCSQSSIPSLSRNA